MAAKKKEEETEVNENASKNALNSLLKSTEDDHFAFIDSQSSIISTGSLQLDSYVKIRSGDIVRLCAKGAELGKTSEAFVIAQNYLDTIPKSKAIYIKSEARLSPEIQRRSGHKFVTRAEDWNYGTVFVFPCNIFETIAKLLEDLLKEMRKSGEHLCIIWDSLDGVILRNDYTKEVWDGKESPKVAGVPLLSKLLFRRFALPLNYYNGLMIVISQYSAEIKLDPYSKDPPRQNSGSGGSSINHMSSYTLSYGPRYNKDLILENDNQPADPVKNKIIGVYATVEITKSGTDTSGTKVRVPIKKGIIGSAIWVSKEVVDICLQWELIKRSGAWYKFSEDFLAAAKLDGVELKESFQGLTSVYDYVESNEDIMMWMKEKAKSLIFTN
jgi:hypothetical protein